LSFYSKIVIHINHQVRLKKKTFKSEKEEKYQQILNIKIWKDP